MAFKEYKEEQGEFFNFNAIGQSLTGKYVKHRPSSGKYGGVNFDFQTASGMKTITVKENYAPGSVLLNAIRTGDLKPGQLVKLTYTGNKTLPGRESAMRMIRVEIDDTTNMSYGSEEDAPF